MARINSKGWLHRFKVRLFLQAVGLVSLASIFGCASGPREVIKVSESELAMPELVRVCNKGAIDHEPDLLGCYEWIGGVCRIYTLPRWVRQMRDGDIAGYHETLGHELDHCLRGPFHGRNKGVPLPRPVRP
jgi:hypothetical protein